MRRVVAWFSLYTDAEPLQLLHYNPDATHWHYWQQLAWRSPKQQCPAFALKANFKALGDAQLLDTQEQVQLRCAWSRSKRWRSAGIACAWVTIHRDAQLQRKQQGC